MHMPYKINLPKKEEATVAINKEEPFSAIVSKYKLSSLPPHTEEPTCQLRMRRRMRKETGAGFDNKIRRRSGTKSRMMSLPSWLVFLPASMAYWQASALRMNQMGAPKSQSIFLMPCLVLFLLGIDCQCPSYTLGEVSVISSESVGEHT